MAMTVGFGLTLSVSTYCLLGDKFFGYGQEVFRYIWSEKTIHPDTGRYNTHDPMCELFPTEVSNNSLLMPT